MCNGHYSKSSLRPRPIPTDCCMEKVWVVFRIFSAINDAVTSATRVTGIQEEGGGRTQNTASCRHGMMDSHRATIKAERLQGLPISFQQKGPVFNSLKTGPYVLTAEIYIRTSWSRDKRRPPRGKNARLSTDSSPRIETVVIFSVTNLSHPPLSHLRIALFRRGAEI
jgi:hypothetical protein